METFFPSSSTETGDAAAMQARRSKLVRGLSEKMQKGENLKSKAKAKQNKVKKTIGALKFILPTGLSTA